MFRRLRLRLAKARLARRRNARTQQQWGYVSECTSRFFEVFDKLEPGHRKSEAASIFRRTRHCPWSLPIAVKYCETALSMQCIQQSMRALNDFGKKLAELRGGA